MVLNNIVDILVIYEHKNINARSKMMEQKVLETVIRSICAYFTLLVLARLIGRKLISRITFFDFIVGVTLGSLSVRMALGAEESLLLSILSAIIITTLVIVTDYLNIKSFKFTKLIDGEPIVLISNGRILDYNLKKVKITIGKLLMQLREKDIFNVADVEFAIIETDGQLTVIPKPNKQPLTTGDLNIQTNNKGITTDIIIDGKIIYDNLKIVNHDEQWLMKQLKSNNVRDVEDVFYGGLDSSENLYISTRVKHENT